jgi:hypothetical protein
MWVWGALAQPAQSEQAARIAEAPKFQVDLIWGGH